MKITKKTKKGNEFIIDTSKKDEDFLFIGDGVYYSSGHTPSEAKILYKMLHKIFGDNK
jgi:hypothetical protein